MPRVTVIVGHDAASMFIAARVGRAHNAVRLFPESCIHPRDHWALVKDQVLCASECAIVTHSETIVNAIGKAIYDGLLPASDVEILIVGETDEKPRRARYDEKGALRDWPYGFLSPIAERREKGGE